MMIMMVFTTSCWWWWWTSDGLTMNCWLKFGVLPHPETVASNGFFLRFTMTVGCFLHPKAILIHRIRKQKRTKAVTTKPSKPRRVFRSTGFRVIDAATFGLNHNFAFDVQMFRFTVSFWLPPKFQGTIHIWICFCGYVIQGVNSPSLIVQLAPLHPDIFYMEILKLPVFF